MKECKEEKTLPRAASSAVIKLVATGIHCYIIPYLMTMHFVDCVFFFSTLQTYIHILENVLNEVKNIRHVNITSRNITQ